MKTRLVWMLLYLLAAALPARCNDPLPEKTLAKLKAATVYVKVKSGNYRAVGSGFVFHVQTQVLYLATNDHVVMVPGQEIPRPRQPPLRLPSKVGNVTVVFDSGTRKERELPANVIFRDPAHDLALLKVKQDEDSPTPLVLPKALKLTETMPVYVLGYPFGEKLDLRKKNPAVTIGKGAISSLREDPRGELARIQIEAEVHPGNSGGPVADASGQLVGVTVAKVEGTRLGMVVPATHLGELMRGQFVEVGLYPKHLAPETSVVCINLMTFDPLKQIESVHFHWLPAAVVATKPQVGQGGLAAVKGSRSLTLEPGKVTWQGLLRLSTPEKGQAVLPFQIVVSRKGKEPQTLPVFTHRWLPNPTAPERRPVAEDEWADLRAALQLPSENYRPRRAALARLAAAEAGEPRQEVLERIRKVLDDPDVYLRESGARALSVWAGEDGLADLLRRLKEEDFPWVRWTLLEELGKLSSDESTQAIVGSLRRDLSSGFPSKVLRGLGPTAQKQVLPLLEDPDASLRSEACRILGAIGTTRSVPALKETVKGDSDPRVVRAAQAALTAIKERK